jgi:hypothetical protein
VTALQIISGGQTGVDRGALDAALQTGTACGGWCPAGRIAEDGVIDPRYPLTPLEVRDYAARTRRNVEDSDATLILYFAVPEGGTALTLACCRRLGRPCLLIDATRTGEQAAVSEILEFVHSRHITRLNVAGPRASKQPAAYHYARAVIGRLLDEYTPSGDNRAPPGTPGVP